MFSKVGANCVGINAATGANFENGHRGAGCANYD